MLARLFVSLDYPYVERETACSLREPAKTARLFASDVLAWVTVRECVVVNCCIDLTLIDWPLDVSFRTKRCKCVELESDKKLVWSFLGSAEDVRHLSLVHSLIYATANFECFCAHVELQNSRQHWRLAAGKCKICTCPLFIGVK